VDGLPDGPQPQRLSVHMPVDRYPQQWCRWAKQVQVDSRHSAEGLQQAAGLKVNVENPSRQVDAGAGGDMVAEGLA